VTDAPNTVVGNIHLSLDAAQLVHPSDISTRFDGVPDERTRTEIEERVRTVLLHSLSSALEEGVPPAEDQSEGPDVGLAGWPISRSRQQNLQQAVKTALGGLATAQSCICFGTPPGDLIALRAQDIIWFDPAGNWVTPPGGAASWVIAVALDSAPFNWARLVLRNGATWNPPVLRSQVLVGLANETDWAKEIEAFNLCSDRIGAVYQAGPNGTPRRMLLSAPDCREGADTIVFNKPGFLGFWHPVGHFPPSSFFRAFGGTVADFTWVID